MTEVVESLSRLCLRWALPPVRAQRSLQSCSAWAVCDALCFHTSHVSKRERIGEPVDLSALFVYYNARKRTGRENLNCAVRLSEVMDSLLELGVCPEELWPYDLARYRDRPSPEAYAAARSFTGFRFEDLGQDWDVLKMRLDDGVPFFFCLRLFGSNCWDFEYGETAKTGILKMPLPNDHIVRNHAVLAVGYEEETLIFRNSYGSDWGDSGYGKAPLGYVLGAGTAYAFWCVV